MRNRILSVMILVALMSLATEAQLTRIVFKKWGNYTRMLGIKAGDQNGDGINDFWLGNHDSTGKGYLELYYGGDPVDTIPKMKLRCIVSSSSIAATSIDLNGDTYSDLILHQQHGEIPPVLRVYFGGPLLDTIPDMVIPFPDTLANFAIIYNSTNRWIDYNGDGRQELVIKYRYSYPDNRPFLAFYKTGSEFTGEPFRKCYLDSNYYMSDYFKYEMGDINGDGCTDIFELATDPDNPDNNKLHVIYGNPAFNFDDHFVFQYSSAYTDFSEWTELFPDMDGDGKDDFLHLDYTNQYPYWIDTKITTGGYPPFEHKLAWRGFNSQEAGFASSQPLPSPGDFNGDGKPEFLRSIGYSEWLWLGGNPSGRDMVADQKFYGYNGRGMIGDVTGDGVDDFITSTITNPSIIEPGFAVIFAGDRTFVSVNDGEEPTVPKTINVEAFPNPFNPSTRVRFTVPTAGVVTLTIFSLSGEELEKRELGERHPGSHEEEINLSSKNAASGIYFAEITLKSGTDVKKERVKLQLLK
ncbi:MAG: T9SS type A sorting domain-containing protein [Ignavibacteria bacterium]|nr:T9SS type A sorting domain-containing protein [Ignavibacteria bacterium]